MDRLNVFGDGAKEAEAFAQQWDDDSRFISAHTSGSTGKPKMIQLLKRDMIVSAEKTCQFFDIKSDSLLGLPLSVSYIAGKMMVVRALSAHADLWCGVPSINPLSTYTSDRMINLLSVVPAQIPNLLESGKSKFVRHLLIGGAPLSHKTEKQIINAGISAYCSYGMTETCSHVALRKVGTKYYVGLDGVTFSIDDRNCLIIKLNDFSINKIATNDVVRLIDERRFEWLGRYDNVINTGGIKIQAEEIERKIAQCLPDNNYYITCRKSDKWGEEIVLVVEADEELPDLTKKIAEYLTRYEMPKAIIYKHQLPRTISGKIKRERL